MTATIGSIGGSGGGKSDIEFEILCDVAATGAITRFLRKYAVDAAGTVTFLDTDLSGVTPYTTLGQVSACISGAESTSECFTVHAAAGAGYVRGDRLIHYLQWNTATLPPTVIANVWYNVTQAAALVAAPLAADLRPCGEDIEGVTFCYIATVNHPTGRYDVGDHLLNARFENVSEYAANGNVMFPISVWYNVTKVGIMSAPDQLTDFRPCDQEQQIVVLCDDNGSFLRKYAIAHGGATVAVDTALDGVTAYTPVGTIKICQSSTIKPCGTCR